MTTPPQETTLPDEPEEGVDSDSESDAPEDLDEDTLPDGPWLDSEDLYDDVSEEELEQGRLLGEQINTEDDDDNGVTG